MTRQCTDRGGRGCPCAWHAKRRVYARNYARRKRDVVIDRKRMRARTCPRKFGRFGVCGAVLVSDTIAGQLVVWCPACERMARGICRDCPAPVDGEVRKARRCAACKAKSLTAATRKYAENNRAQLNRKGRESYRKNEERRLRRNEYKRLYRAAHPEKVREYKRREALTQNPNRAAYLVAYRAKMREQRAAYERDRVRGALELRTCITPGCDIVVTHKKRKCTRCKEAARRAAQQALASTYQRRRSDQHAA